MSIVLVTNGLLHGGAERIVEVLALGLARDGLDVSVVAVTRDGPIGDSLRRAGIPVDVLGIRSPFDARIPLQLAWVARKRSARILHSHLEVSDIAVAMASFLRPRTKLVSTIHNLGTSARSQGRYRRFLWNRALPRFDAVLAVSEAVAARLPSALHATVVKPSIVWSFEPPLERARARSELGLGEGDFIVLGVGRLSPEKGFDLLGLVADRVAQPGCRFLLIGDGPERPRLERHERLEKLGARDDARRFIAAADVVVCPSRTEGFPQVPLEAMHAGVPVIATSVGGSVEIVAHESSGLLVPPDDPQAIEAAIQRLRNDVALARAMGERGRARLEEEHLTAEAMCLHTLEVYRRLLES